MKNTPFSCAICGNEVNPKNRALLREVVGWTKGREQGGVNHVLFRRETGRYMCESCETRRKYGLSEQQESLL